MTDNAYTGREQSEVKHHLLGNYLEQLLYNVLSSQTVNEFVYVDGFAGPWKAASQDFSDTSVFVALKKLSEVKTAFARRGRVIKMRAFFVEEDPNSYGALERLVSRFPLVASRPLLGRFEDRLDDISAERRDAFMMAFVDPTGWTGFNTSKLKGLLSGRCEVLVNFMFDYINRFISHPDESVRNSFGGLFSDPDLVRNVVARTSDPVLRAELLVDKYCEGLKQTCNFPHAAATCVYKSDADRPYFFLVLGTKHPKGLEVFRKQEMRSSIFQEIQRTKLKRRRREGTTGQFDLLETVDQSWPNRALIKTAKSNVLRLEAILLGVLRRKKAFKFSEALPICLELRLVSRSTVSNTLHRLRAQELVTFDLPGRKRNLDDDTIVRMGPKLNDPN